MRAQALTRHQRRTTTPDASSSSPFPCVRPSLLLPCVRPASSIQPSVRAFFVTQPPSPALIHASQAFQPLHLPHSDSTAGSTSPAGEVGLVENNETSQRVTNVKVELGCLATEFGWKVRRLAPIGDEIREASHIQAQAFYEFAFVFNDFFFELFKAEVLAGLMYKLRNSPQDRYACLVAEAETGGDTSSSDSKQGLVGVVDVTILRDQNVLNHLPYDSEEYLYISGIAILESFRRRKIATVLLKACDMVSNLWGFVTYKS